MKKFIVALVRMMLWYEAQFWSDRIAFAGGTLAGTLIAFVVGLVAGFGYYQALGSVVFAIAAFVVILIFASGVFYVGKKYGDRKPMEDLLKEIEKD
jgi:acid phosphatase family membrane protein YuiD